MRPFQIPTPDLMRAARAREMEARAAYPPEGRFIDIGAWRVHVTDTGPRDAPAIVLVHGAGGSTRDFSFGFTQTLAGHRVVAIDRPGHGWTYPMGDTERHAYLSPQDQARLLWSVLDRLDITDPLLVGHSFGGAVVLGMGLARPGAPAGLVAIAPASSPNIPSLGLAGFAPIMRVSDAVAAAAAMLATDAMVEAFVARIFAPDPVPDGYVAQSGARLALLQGRHAHRMCQIAVLRESLMAMSASYFSITLPCMVIHGTEDRVLRYAHHGVWLSQALPHARLVTLPGTGHMPHHARRDAVAQAILGFQASLLSGGT